MNKQERDEAVIRMVKEISEKVKKGEKLGDVKCPFCGGKVDYCYENDMAVAAQCAICGLYLRA